MSRQNKVNPDRYKTAGRLSPDDLARERQAQHSATPTERPRRGDERPSWMAQDQDAKPSAEAEPTPSEDGDEEPPKEDQRVD